MLISTDVPPHNGFEATRKLPRTSTMMRDRAIGGASSSSHTNNNDNGVRNFSTFPGFNLQWGRRIQFMCVKDQSLHRPSPTRSELNESRKRRSSSCDADSDGNTGDDKFEIDDPRNQVNETQAFPPLNGAKNSLGVNIIPAATGEGRPWNLRTRRAVCKVVNNNADKHNISPVKPIGRSDHQEEKNEPRAKFAVSLSKREIEKDFLAITGNRPARRPKKRGKHVQKQIDLVFPGLWLSEITPDMYKVDEQLPGEAKRQ